MIRKLISQIENYKPYNEQEIMDKDTILSMLKTYPDIFDRTNLIAHITASGWVVNYERTKVLMAYHKIYDSWAWLGGHADGNKNLLEVAIKEIKEESGLNEVRPITEDIYSLEVLVVSGHEKKSAYVPSHLHLNITYIFEADETAQLKINEDENTAVSWFQKEKAIQMSSEPWFKERIYRKLNDKLDDLSKK